MNKDQVKGGFNEAKGKTKEEIGDATNNRKLEAKGKLEKTGGKVQKGFGDAKDEA
ncbi:MAG: CsbD family protein [Xanthomonadaceae bacterium]|nr:CsbD family protein [Xanthomonadaceae bacterium]